MTDITDLLKLGSEDPEAFKAILGNKEKLTAFNVSSADLAALKKMDPATLKLAASGIEASMKAKGDSNACKNGTNACKRLGMDELSNPAVSNPVVSGGTPINR